MKDTVILGAAVGHCAAKKGCEYAPEEIYHSLSKLKSYWRETLYFSGKYQGLGAVPQLVEFSNRLRQAVRKIIQQDKRFLIFGGDHSCAVGTWSGVASCHPNFGLIWVDAHLDAHTPETSPSGNLHGMPVAILLGYGDEQLVPKIRVKPENLVLIGVRSYEQGELALLRRLGVRIFTMDEVRERSLGRCFSETLKEFRKRNIRYGISLDLDALDTQHISGLGTPEADGIDLEQICLALSKIEKSKLLGMEIAEYNPKLSSRAKEDLAAIEQIAIALLK